MKSQTGMVWEGRVKSVHEIACSRGEPSSSATSAEHGAAPVSSAGEELTSLRPFLFQGGRCMPPKKEVSYCTVLRYLCLE